MLLLKILITELDLLMNDKDLEKYCYCGMIAVFPDKNKQEHIDKLLILQVDE